MLRPCSGGGEGRTNGLIGSRDLAFCTGCVALHVSVYHNITVPNIGTSYEDYCSCWVYIPTLIYFQPGELI